MQYEGMKVIPGDARLDAGHEPVARYDGVLRDDQLDFNDLRPAVVPEDAEARVTLARHLARRHAWEMVTKALEDALSVPGLPADDALALDRMRAPLTRHVQRLALPPESPLRHRPEAPGLYGS